MNAFEKQMRDIAAAREDRTKMDIANVGADSANQAQQIQLMKALYGEFPLARATLENKQSNEQMQRQIDVMKMLQGDKTKRDVAKMQGEYSLAGQQARANAQRERDANKIPSVGAPPETYRMKKIQEIVNASKDASGKPTMMADDPQAEILANQEWIRENAAFKKGLPSQLQQAPAPAPQKTSSAGPVMDYSKEGLIAQMMLGAAPLQGNSAQIVPGSETNTPEMEDLILRGFSGQPAINGSFAGTGDYGESGTLPALKRAYPNQSPMYQNREIQENIAMGYQKPFMSAADMDKDNKNPVIGYNRTRGLGPGGYMPNSYDPVRAIEPNMPPEVWTEMAKTDYRGMPGPPQMDDYTGMPQPQKKTADYSGGIKPFKVPIAPGRPQWTGGQRSDKTVEALKRLMQFYGIGSNSDMYGKTQGMF